MPSDLVTGFQTCALPIWCHHVGDLRNGSVTPCTLAGREEGTSDYPGIASRSEERRVGKECRSRRAQLELKIATEGVIDDCRLGWLAQDTMQDVGAVGDGV